MKAKTSSLFTAIGLTIALAAPASAAVLLTDNFTATASTYDVNNNLAARQTGTQATSSWTGLNNAQVGNNTVFGGDGNYLMVADANGRATLNTLNLASLVASNEKLVISFDIAAFNGGYGWASFTLGNLVTGQNYGVSQPNTSATDFAFIYRNNTGIDAWDNGASVLGVPTTTGGSNFTFTFSDAATQTASPFGVDAKVTIQNGANTIGTYTLAGGLSATNTYITFGTTDSTIGDRGKIDNLVVETIPEPGAALLGGLGLLALLRRRR